MVIPHFKLFVWEAGVLEITQTIMVIVCSLGHLQEVQSKNLLPKLLNILVTGLRNQVSPDKEISHDTYPVSALIMLSGAM